MIAILIYIHIFTYDFPSFHGYPVHNYVNCFGIPIKIVFSIQFIYLMYDCTVHGCQAILTLLQMAAM